MFVLTFNAACFGSSVLVTLTSKTNSFLTLVYVGHTYTNARTCIAANQCTAWAMCWCVCVRLYVCANIIQLEKTVD